MIAVMRGNRQPYGYDESIWNKVQIVNMSREAQILLGVEIQHSIMVIFYEYIAATRISDVNALRTAFMLQKCHQEERE